MTWTTPMTAVANTALTAAQFNTHVRDNLNETAPAKATVAGRIFVTTGPNAIAERLINGATVNTSETTASTSFTDLATIGPTVPLITTGIRALLFFNCQLNNGTAGAQSKAGVTVSGATSAPADDNIALSAENTAFYDVGAGRSHFYSGLTAGSNTFTMQYKVSAGTGTFLSRHLFVIPL